MRVPEECARKGNQIHVLLRMPTKLGDVTLLAGIYAGWHVVSKTLRWMRTFYLLFCRVNVSRKDLPRPLALKNVRLFNGLVFDR